MKTIQVMLFIAMVAVVVNCKKNDDDPVPPKPVIIEKPKEVVQKSDAKEITSFVFRATTNSVLSADVTGTIDESAKTILIEVPPATDVTALVPVLTISEKASVTPEGALNFSAPVSFKVTAEDGSTIDYEVTVNVLPSSEKKLLEFRFEGIMSEGVNVAVLATIDEENNTITATMPAGTSIIALTPEIELSEAATFEPQGPQNFSEAIDYLVTAEDGTSVTYKVVVDVKLTEKEILLKIAEVNSIDMYNWDKEVNLIDFEGVFLNSQDKVVKIRIDSYCMTILPPEIGQLQSLEELSIYQTNLVAIPPEIGQLKSLEELVIILSDLAILPPEIGQLSSLKGLFLSHNKLRSIPKEIGQLSNLGELELDNNMLTELPSQIGQLSALQLLNLGSNQIEGLPPSIGELAALQSLFLHNNLVNCLPAEIGQLDGLQTLWLGNNKLTSLPPEIGQLSQLISLGLDNNEPFSPPSEIGNLTNLRELTLDNNGILVLDGDICDLERNSTTDIDIYPGVVCSN